MTNDELLDAAHDAHVAAHGLTCGWQQGARTSNPCVLLWRAWRLRHPAEAVLLWKNLHREDLAAKQRAWNRDHPEQRREYLARPEVRERTRQQSRQSEHRREYTRNYKLANRAHASEMEHIRRTRKRNSLGRSGLTPRHSQLPSA